MGAFLYGVSLQWKLDIRSKTLLITCYIVLYRASFVFCNYGRYIYISHARSEIYAYSVNDCVWCDNGGVDWSATLSC